MLGSADDVAPKLELRKAMQDADPLTDAEIAQVEAIIPTSPRARDLVRPLV